MGTTPQNSRSVLRLDRAWLALPLVVAFGCGSQPPPTNLPSPGASATPGLSASPSGLTTPPTPPAKVVGDLALEQCDAEGLLPCEHQAVVLAEPLAATGVSLTYSSEWADGRIDRPVWNADSLGLGGWSLDVLHRYDQENGVLLSGDGSWRIAEAIDIGDGERAVAAYDGFRYFVFDQEWRHVRTVDSVTGTSVVNLTYDESGGLSSVRGNLDGVRIELTVERSADGEPQAMLGMDGTPTRLALDADGRVVAIGHGDGTYLFITLGTFGLARTWASTGGGPVTAEYDAAGRVSSVVDADGVALHLTYESTASSVSVATEYATGGTATLRFERVGDGLRRTWHAADGTLTTLEARGDQSTTLTQPDGTTTTVGAVAHPRWGLSAPIRTPYRETRPAGAVYQVDTTTTMATGSSEPAGEAWRAEIVVDGDVHTESYDPQTRTLARTDPEGRISTFVFDDQARLIEARPAGGRVVAYAYDDAGRLASVTVGEGDLAAVTTYTYDTSTGQVVELRPDGTILTASFDAFGNLVRASTDGENAAFARGAAGEIIQVRSGKHPASSIGYSDAGRETAHIPPVVGDDASYELRRYTPAGQLAEIEGPGDRRIGYSYDTAGRVTSWTFDRGTFTADYGSEDGLLESTSSPDGLTTSFTYDGRVPVGLAWAGPVSGDVRLSMDALLRPTSEAVNGADQFDFGYDSAGLLASIDDLAIARDPVSGLSTAVALGGVETVHAYDTNGRLISTVVTSQGGALLGMTYTRDLLGRVVGIERTDASGASTSTTYTYDATGRVMAMDQAGVTETYSYDESGNRTVLSGGTVAFEATFDDRDRLLTWADETFRYSPDGTLLEREGPEGRTTYDFDDLRQLRSVTLPDGRRVEYLIDAGGRRIGRMVDGVLTDGYLYGVDDSIVAWLDGSGALVAHFAYDDNGNLALVSLRDRDLLVVTDQVGSPIAVIDPTSGEVDETFTYDAWGNLVDGGASELMPFGFAGGLVDHETGLVHFGARDYDPTTGRWTAPDPIRYRGGDLNLYRYASGDPVNLVDRTGSSACSPGSCSVAPRVRPAGGTPPIVTPPSGYQDVTPPSGYRDVTPPSGYQPAPKDPGDGPITICIGPCYTPGQGVSGAAPGENPVLGGCFGYCVPASESTGVCLGLCGGASDNGGFICVIACGYGEPHIVTADGVHVDFQAAGEFTFANSADGALTIQARFETPPQRTNVTRTTALAVLVAGDRVAFYADAERPMIVNGEVVERAEYAATLPGGGGVERHGSYALVAWPDGSQLVVELYAGFMNFGMSLPDGSGASLVGLAGGRDGNQANDLTTRDGVVIDPADPAFFDLLYDQFAASWRIAQDESLFDYLPGESTATFQRPEIPSEPATVEGLDEASRATAEALCRAAGVTSDPILSDCILDVALTGDPTYAGSAQAVNAAIELAGSSIADRGTAVEVGQPVSAQLASGASDRYHFAAQAGDVVYLDALGTCTDRTFWRLLTPEGNLFTFDHLCVDIGRRVLDRAGDWLIEVYSDPPTASAYSFQVISAPAAREKAVQVGESVADSIDAIGEWHRYRLAANAGDIVYFNATGDCVDRLYWRLLRPEGNLATFEQACTDMGREVLVVAGDWVVEVYSDTMATGAYAFTTVAVPQPTETPISLDQQVADSIDAVGAWHRYRLTAAAGDTVYLDAAGTECVDNLFWRLLRPDGALRDFSQTCGDIGREVLEVPGDWVIEVYSDSEATGPYAFVALGVPTARETPLSLGQVVTDTIDQIAEWHRYRLSATAGQTLSFDALGTECVDGLFWRLLNPDGSLVTFERTCVDMGSRTLDVAGDWIVEVYSDVMTTGAYSFRVDPG